MATPDKGIPFDIAAKAHCIHYPWVQERRFHRGRAVWSGCSHLPDCDWLERAGFYPVSAVDFGPVGQSTDLVLVGVNRRSLDDLLKDKVKLGGDIAAWAGPVGHDSQASTTELANAEFLAYFTAKAYLPGRSNPATRFARTRPTQKLFTAKIVPYKTISVERFPLLLRHTTSLPR